VIIHSIFPIKIIDEWRRASTLEALLIALASALPSITCIDWIANHAIRSGECMAFHDIPPCGLSSYLIGDMTSLEMSFMYGYALLM